MTLADVLITWGALSIVVVGFMYCCSVVSKNDDFWKDE